MTISMMIKIRIAKTRMSRYMVRMLEMVGRIFSHNCHISENFDGSRLNHFETSLYSTRYVIVFTMRTTFKRSNNVFKNPLHVPTETQIDTRKHNSYTAIELFSAHSRTQTT